MKIGDRVETNVGIGTIVVDDLILDGDPCLLVKLDKANGWGPTDPDTGYVSDKDDLWYCYIDEVKLIEKSLSLAELAKLYGE